MNEGERRDLVTAIHRAPGMLVLAVAGGGNAVVTDLLDVPGASRTVLEVRVPYAETAMIDLVGPAAATDADGFVSDAMAQAMAVACLERARALAPASEHLIGVGATAALVSDRPKKGEHRAFLAVAGVDGVGVRKVSLVKGELDRRGEDRVVADALLIEIANGIGLEGPGSGYRR